MPSRNYRDLIVWQKAMNLVENIYRASRKFPKDELYALTNQIRRAAVSIPSNIAEGQGRGSDAEMARFLRIAHGSLREVETQALIAERLAYAEPDQTQQIMEMAGEVGRLLNGLIRSNVKQRISSAYCLLPTAYYVRSSQGETS
jgi:four helix bundle protein